MLLYGRKLKYHKQVAMEFPEFADYTFRAKSMTLFLKQNIGLDLV